MSAGQVTVEWTVREVTSYRATVDAWEWEHFQQTGDELLFSDLEETENEREHISERTIESTTKETP
ncbi:hypothetical protein SEA_SADLAD_86 [Microbacterium phage SadLad]|nr:hypothetical protein SEA_SADLAD_86 [Microbacterium phage SadLad]